MAASRDPSKNILDDFAREIRQLKSRVADLENQKIVSLRGVDTADFPANAPNNEIAIGNDGVLYRYDDTIPGWTTFAGGGGTSTLTERIHTTYTYTHGTGFSALSAFTHDSGDTLTDLTTAGTFKPLAAGLYAVTIWGNDNTSTGDTTGVEIQFHLQTTRFFPYTGIGPVVNANMIGVGGVGAGYYQAATATLVTPVDPSPGDKWDLTLNKVGDPPNTSGDIYINIAKISA